MYHRLFWFKMKEWEIHTYMCIYIYTYITTSFFKVTLWFPKWRSRFTPWKGHGYAYKRGHFFKEPGTSSFCLAFGSGSSLGSESWSSHFPHIPSQIIIGLPQIVWVFKNTSDMGEWINKKWRFMTFCVLHIHNRNEMPIFKVNLPKK